MITAPFNFGAESPDDYAAIDEVHDRAFLQDGESRLVRALREQGYADPKLSLVARAGERVVAHLLFSDLNIEHDHGSLKALALAPVAVLPEFQRQGIGTSLIWEGIERARDAGHSAILVLGDPAYYGRFDFSLKLGAHARSVYNGPYFMGLELREVSLSSLNNARVFYPAPFSLV
jgi:putative acetyltransferase